MDVILVLAEYSTLQGIIPLTLTCSQFRYLCASIHLKKLGILNSTTTEIRLVGGPFSAPVVSLLQFLTPIRPSPLDSPCMSLVIDFYHITSFLCAIQRLLKTNTITSVELVIHDDKLSFLDNYNLSGSLLNILSHLPHHCKRLRLNAGPEHLSRPSLRQHWMPVYTPKPGRALIRRALAALTEVQLSLPFAIAALFRIQFPFCFIIRNLHLSLSHAQLQLRQKMFSRKHAYLRSRILWSAPVVPHWLSYHKYSWGLIPISKMSTCLPYSIGMRTRLNHQEHVSHYLPWQVRPSRPSTLHLILLIPHHFLIYTFIRLWRSPFLKIEAIATWCGRWLIFGYIPKHFRLLKALWHHSPFHIGFPTICLSVQMSLYIGAPVSQLPLAASWFMVFDESRYFWIMWLSPLSYAFLSLYWSLVTENWQPYISRWLCHFPDLQELTIIAELISVDLNSLSIGYFQVLSPNLQYVNWIAASHSWSNVYIGVVH